MNHRWVVLLGDCTQLLPTLQPDLADPVHIITDPPYSEHQHKSVRSGKRSELGDQPCRVRSPVDLGFAHLDARTRRLCAREFARLATRWVLAFSDVESCHLWRRSLVACGLDYARACEWQRINGAPQFTGDRPAASFEAITACHPPGRKRWNGGGKQGVYPFPVVANRLGQRGSRVHTTQKPLALMEALIMDFTDPGDLVIDPFCGSGTTGVAAVRLGRRFVGIEREPEYARIATERIAAAASEAPMGVTGRQVRLFA